MKKILNYLNCLDMDQTTEHIISGEVASHIFSLKAREVSHLTVEDQSLYMSTLSQRMSQTTKPHKMLSVLALVDNILKTVPNTSLPKYQFNDLKVNQKSKEHLLLVNVGKYYDYFLKLNNESKYHIETVNAEEELEEAEHYCQLALLKIVEFIKIDFIFVYAWTKIKDHKVILREIVSSILDRFRIDLGILTNFVKNNIDFVLQKTQKHPLTCNINYVYEKLIFINKEMKKLEKIAKLYGVSTVFPKYEIDLDLNRAVELEMLEMKDEKRDFLRSLTKKEEFQKYMEEAEIMTTQSFIILDNEDLDE